MALTIWESIGPTGEQSHVVTMFKNALYWDHTTLYLSEDSLYDPISLIVLEKMFISYYKFCHSFSLLFLQRFPFDVCVTNDAKSTLNC